MEGVADGAFAGIRGDGAWEVRGKAAFGVVGAQIFFADVDIYPREGREGSGADIGNDEVNAGRRIGPGRAGVQLAQGGTIQVVGFGHFFFDGGKTEALHARAFEPGGWGGSQSRMIGGGDHAGGHEVVGCAKALEDVGIDFAGWRLIMFELPSDEGVAALGAPAAIDAAG